MPGLLPDIDPDGLLEYLRRGTPTASVNHMSVSFQTVMNDISRVLGDVYNADAVVVVPGSGTYGMEAVARQFATGEHRAGRAQRLVRGPSLDPDLRGRETSRRATQVMKARSGRAR